MFNAPNEKSMQFDKEMLILELCQKILRCKLHFDQFMMQKPPKTGFQSVLLPYTRRFLDHIGLCHKFVPLFEALYLLTGAMKMDEIKNIK